MLITLLESPDGLVRAETDIVGNELQARAVMLDRLNKS